MTRPPTLTEKNMPLTENALKILEKRYLLKNSDGSLAETPEGMFKRVARAAAEADRLYDPKADTGRTEETFFSMTNNLEFLPNSPTLMNAGRPLGQLSACFVLPIGDSMEEIFDAMKFSALIHKSGGGTGFSFSKLRQKGSPVQTTGGTSSGPVSFMKLFDLTTEVVKQGGKRRGANMGILNVSHPDILEFITCKNKPGEFENFNISVGITEEFIGLAEEGLDYELVDPRNGSASGKLNAGEVFNLIAETAWGSGEPGIVFLDRINRENPTPQLGIIESTNPCGEQPLLPYESCNLGSINLSLMVKDSNGRKEVDFDRLGSLVHKAVHFLDNVIDINKYPLDIIKNTTLETRKIGLGVMGFADMLCILGIPYKSDTALKLAEQLMDFIRRQARMASSALAKHRGPFPAYQKSVFKSSGEIIRNATTTTIAPTGTLSIISGTSSGIEPLFAVSYTRRSMEEEFTEINSVFRQYLTDAGIYSQELIERIGKSGSIENISEIPEHIRKIFVTAHEIEPEWHVRMQAAFQKYTDNAVSKTVNLKRDASVEQVKEVFMLAYKLGLKGITVYRDGSRESQVLNIDGGNRELCIDCS